MKNLVKLCILIIMTLSNLQICLAKSNEAILRDILSDESKPSKKKIDKKKKSIKKQVSKKIETKSETKPEASQMPSPATSDKILLENGINLYNSSNYTSAIARFKELIEKHSDSPFKDQAAIWKAKSHVRIGEYDIAIKELNNVKEDSGEYPNALYTAGVILMKRKEYDKATKFLFKCANQFPDHELADNAMLKLGKIYLRQKKGSMALGEGLKLVTLYFGRETEDDAYFLLATIFEKDPYLKDFERARKILKKFIYKAEVEKTENFKNSPLLKTVRNKLFYIERNFFTREIDRYLGY